MCFFALKTVTVKSQTLPLKHYSESRFPFGSCSSSSVCSLALLSISPLCYAFLMCVTLTAPTFPTNRGSTCLLTAFCHPEELLCKEAGSWRAVCSGEHSSGLHHKPSFGGYPSLSIPVPSPDAVRSRTEVRL